MSEVMEINIDTCYICKGKADKETPFTADDGTKARFGICNKCEEEDAFHEWENEQYYTTNIVCPWCGHEESDSWECIDEDESAECSSCEKEFEYERYTEVSYCSRKPKHLYKEGLEEEKE